MHGWKINALLGLAAGLLLLPAAGRAQTAGDKVAAPDKTLVKKRVVLIDDEGKGDKVIDSFAKRVPRGFLGVGLLDLTPELRVHFGVPEEAGVMVSKVEPGSPAEKAGIKVGDILTALDGKPATSSLDLRRRVRSAEDGTQTSIELWRKGKVQTLTATLEKRDRPELDLAPLFKKDGDRVIFHFDGEDSAMPFKFEPGQPIRIQRLQGREVDLEKHLKELEKRIKDLERQLDKQQKQH
jgi:membrane-associated protease RseP (regulator of RpoE activity)